uniref:BamA/OMP85 family outer membrane protein n=1 Tax=Flavobacterium sp. TaxID=239 RepID=UPI004049C36C
MLNNCLKSLLVVLILLYTSKNFAQNTDTFERGKPYILGDIDVQGKLNFNKPTVITFTGLEKGQKIILPGEEISTAIKKLAKLELFSDIDLYITNIKGDSIFLELYIVELPKLNEAKVRGVKKGKIEAILKDTDLKRGKVVNENLVTTTKNYLENKYKKDGFYNTKVSINVEPDTTENNQVKMYVNIDKGKKVKINKIEVEGNEILSDWKVKRAMKKTKTIFPGRFWKGSKFIPERYKEDLENVVNKYKSKGYRDARIVWDSTKFNPKTNRMAIKLKIEEGRKYYFGDIKFLGNTIYSDEGLSRVLGIQKGDVYNGVMLEERIADKTKPDANDITNLYQNNGYLFSQINAVEVRTENDTIDFEIRILEGPLAYFNKITVVGNDRTNDKVIYRELRTKPGQKYSKDDLVRSIREIGQLGFFDAENLEPKFKNVNPEAGTVDIEYNVVEKGASQIELQGGYGGGGFIGTLGLSFNNFSIRNIFKKEAYTPLPMGDGQRMALRLQASAFFQTYSLNFTEPWLGGKKPIQFNTSIAHSKQFLWSGGGSSNVDRSRSFNITSLSIGMSKRLKFPDDYFSISHALSFQYYDLNNYNTGLFTFGDGSSKNLAYTVGLVRNNKGLNPIYPTQGSEFSIVAKLSPPFSLFNGIDYANLGNQEEYKYVYDGDGYFDSNNNFVAPGDYLSEVPTNINPQPDKVDNFEDAAVDQSKVDQKRFNWQEFYKIKFRADLYNKIYDKLVLRTLGEFSYLGAYNNDRGVIPFERFFLGGDGLANFALDGREIIQLRGYPNQSLSSVNGGTIYNKFSLELRYPITLNNSASIYALTFLEAGASYNSFKEYNPFQLYRSAGFGIRIFMPAFGLLGIDFGHGFDPLPGSIQKNGWETHFIIGQQF